MKIPSQLRTIIDKLSWRRGTIPRSLFSVFLAAGVVAAETASAQNVPVTQGFSQPVTGLSALNTLDNFSVTNSTANVVRASQPMNLSIGLPLNNQGALSNLLQQLYDPASTNYQQFLTPDQFTAMFGPTTNDYQAVINYVQSYGLTVTATYSNRMVLDVSGTVPQVESAFGVVMLVYQDPSGSNTFYAPNVQPSVPSTVPILGIEGMNNSAQPQPNSQLVPLANQSDGANAGAGPSGEYGGNDFRKAYLPDLNPALNGSGQVVGLLEFDGYLASDITAYENNFGLNHVPLQNVLVGGFNGTPSGGGGQTEVTLDIEMAIAMAPNLSKVIVYEAPGTTYSTGWYSILNAMASPVQGVLPKQLSCSWFAFSRADLVAENIFKAMAAQGQSFFAASGDSDAYCAANPYEAYVNFIWGSSQIPFPCDSPNITLVGGTTLTTTGPGGSWVSEHVWNWGFQGYILVGSTYYASYVGSSGGISSQYSIPSWQTGISMSGNQGSTTLRNVPDVALTADNVAVYVNGAWASGGVGGTSCAAPLWAGVTALINQQAGFNGRPSVGFVNPAIYTLGKGSLYANCFRDTITGNNYGDCGSEFSAVSGYDLATGWGAPKGQALISALAGPSAPTGLAARPGNGQVLLNWNSSSDATSYYVKRSTTSGGPYTTLANPTSASYTDSSAVQGTMYYYVVSAVYNGIQGANSAQVGPVSPIGLLNTARMFHTAVLLTGGQVLVAGGLSFSSGTLASAELYNPATGKWTATGSMNNSRMYHTMTLLPNGKVLVAGGFNFAGGYLTSAELYDPTTGLWTTTGSLNTARQDHTATLLPNGTVLVAGGDNSSGTLTSSEIYNPSTGLWTSTGSLLMDCKFHTATLISNGSVLEAGGYGSNPGGYLSAVETYLGGVWGGMPGGLLTAREHHTATVLLNGKVLVAGGDNASGNVAASELYNPAVGPPWVGAGSLITPRTQHTATLLSNGSVLLAGGYGSTGVLASEEAYSGSAWASTGSLIAARVNHTATLLPNGTTVLFAGGIGGGGTPLSSAELYNP